MADVVLSKLETHRPEDVERKRLAPPFSILYLANALEAAGFEVALHHSQADPQGIADLVDLTRRTDPLFVGVSVMTPHVLPARDASRAIKAALDVPVVWGGIHPTIVPAQTAALPYVDLACTNEGEETVVELARCIRAHGLDWDRIGAIRGMVFTVDGKVVETEPRPFMPDLDGVRAAWHHLRREDYFYPGRYFYSGKGGDRVAVLNTSRGCPFRCAYCYNQVVNRRSVRMQSPARVLEEVAELKERYGVTGILFAEDNFFAKHARALEIAQALERPWSSTISIPDMLAGGEELLKKLAATGCVELRIGVESGSTPVLRLMNKKYTADDTVQVARWVADAGIMGVYMFMTGIPGESWDDALATLDLIDRLRDVSTNLRITGPSFYAPYPATELHDKAVEMGYCPPVSLEDWSRNIPGNHDRLPPYADARMPKLAFYRILTAQAQLPRTLSSIPVRVLRKIGALRWKRRAFRGTIEHSLALGGIRVARRLGLKRIVHPLYRRFFADV